MIEVTWANAEKNIVLWKFPSQWMWHDFFAALKDADAMIDGVEGIVDSIFLTPQDQVIPQGGIRNFKLILARRHARHGLIILVDAQTLLVSLLGIVLKLIPNARPQMHFVQSEAEAYALIAAAQQQRLQDRASQVAGNAV